jgi:hypothetical protein
MDPGQFRIQHLHNRQSKSNDSPLRPLQPTNITDKAKRSVSRLHRKTTNESCSFRQASPDRIGLFFAGKTLTKDLSLGCLEDLPCLRGGMGRERSASISHRGSVLYLLGAAQQVQRARKVGRRQQHLDRGLGLAQRRHKLELQRGRLTLSPPTNMHKAWQTLMAVPVHDTRPHRGRAKTQNYPSHPGHTVNRHAQEQASHTAGAERDRVPLRIYIPSCTAQ